MNSTTDHKLDAVEFMRGIVAAVPATLVSHLNAEQTQPNFILVTLNGGPTFDLMLNWGAPGKWHVSGNYPRTEDNNIPTVYERGNPVARPSIYVSASRSWFDLGKDIGRRFVAKFLAVHAKTKAYVEQEAADLLARDELSQAVAYAGAGRWHGKNIFDRSARGMVELDKGRVQVGYRGSARFTIDTSTPEQAKALAAFLRTLN